MYTYILLNSEFFIQESGQGTVKRISANHASAYFPRISDRKFNHFFTCTSNYTYYIIKQLLKDLIGNMTFVSPRAVMFPSGYALGKHDCPRTHKRSCSLSNPSTIV